MDELRATHLGSAARRRPPSANAAADASGREEQE